MFYAGIQGSLVVGICTAICEEQLLRNRLRLTQVAPWGHNRIACPGNRCRINVLYAAKTYVGSAQEWRLCIGVNEHVVRLVPGTAQNIAFARFGLVPGPLLHVSSHVVVAPGAHSEFAADAHDTKTAKVACGYDEKRRYGPSRAIPVIERRQVFARVLRVGRGLIPTDAGHRKVVLSLRVFPLNPIFRAGSSRPVVEHRHGLVPRQLLTVLAELLFPIRSLLISPVINEGLELSIRHLILID